MTPLTTESVRPATEAEIHPLDRAAWASLTGPQAHFAQGEGQARRYRAELSPFAAISSPEDERAWADLQVLYGERQTWSSRAMPDSPQPGPEGGWSRG